MFILFFTQFEFLPTAFAVILAPLALPIVPKVEFNRDFGEIICFLRMYVAEKQADLKNVGRRGSADLHHIYVA